MKNIKNDTLYEKSFALAVSIVSYCSQLDMIYPCHTVPQQLLKSGTAVRVLLQEAQKAEHQKCFLQKIAFTTRKVQETQYCIELLRMTIESTRLDNLHLQCTEILQLLSSTAYSRQYIAPTIASTIGTSIFKSPSLFQA